MNHTIPNLQIHIHKVDGSTTTFVQNDAGEVKRILDGFEPMNIFDQDRFVIIEGNSITTLPVSRITRIDLDSEQHSHLLFQAGVVDAVELAESEFLALVRNPIMRKNWEQMATQDDTLVAFLDLELANGQCLFLTMEMRVDLQSEELWKTNGLPLEGSSLCFRMRTGGVAVLNLANLIRLTFFPKPVHQLEDRWHAIRLNSRHLSKPDAVGNSGSSTPGSLPPASLFLQDKPMNFRSKQHEKSK